MSMSRAAAIVRQIIPAQPGWSVASPINHGEFVEVWLDPVLAWACHASYVDGHDVPTFTNSDPIVGGEMAADQPGRAIKRPDGKFMVPEDCCLEDKVQLVAWWRENGFVSPLRRGAGQ